MSEETRIAPIDFCYKLTDPQLKPIQEENLAGWEKVCEDPDLTPQMRYALRLIAAGISYRLAATEAGYPTHNKLHWAARKHGIVSVKTERLVGKFRRLASLGVDELERRLVDEGEDFSTRDLSVAMGISADKVERFEARKHENEGGFIDRVTELLEKMKEAGMSMEVKLSPPENRNAIEEGTDTPVIDVTATSSLVPREGDSKEPT